MMFQIEFFIRLPGYFTVPKFSFAIPSKMTTIGI